MQLKYFYPAAHIDILNPPPPSTTLNYASRGARAALLGQVVNLCRNHLYALPEELGAVPYLKELHADMNRLDVLPESLTKLRGLEVPGLTMLDAW